MSRLSSPESLRPPRRRWRRLRYWLLALLSLLLVLGLAAWWLARQTPSWYHPLSAQTPNVDLLADNAQQGLLALYNRHQNAVFADQTWTISQADLNALLVVRYAAAGGPAATGGLSAPQVLFTDDTITFSARSTALPSPDPAGGVMTLALTVRTVAPESGATTPRLQIALDGAWVGRLPVPRALVERQAEAAVPKLIEQLRQTLVTNVGPRQADQRMPTLEQWIRHVQRGEPFTARWPHDQTRSVALKKIKVTDGQLTVTLGPP